VRLTTVRACVGGRLMRDLCGADDRASRHVGMVKLYDACDEDAV
jgi:hypothetical protein